MATSTKRSDQPNLVLGRVLREAREDASLTQHDVAVELGLLHNNIIARIEHGVRKLSLLEFLDFARVVKREPSELIDEFQKRMDH